LSAEPIETNFRQRHLRFCGQAVEQLDVAVLYDVQGKSKLRLNFAKSAQIQRSSAKEIKGISFDFLVRIEPYQGLALTPKPVFSFARPSASR
jgi:hypothetical protein